MDTSTLLPPGVYRILVAGLGEIGPDALTRQDDTGVTILPPGVVPDSEQEWFVRPTKDGNVTVTKPSGIRPPNALTYRGAPHAKEGARVVHHVIEFATEWHIGIAPGFRSTIQAPGTHLGIAIGPEKIHPPFLELSEKRQLNWVFKRVRDE